MIDLDDIRAARSLLEGRLHRTPTMGSTFLGSEIGAELAFKLEMFPKTGSFKPRGVYNNLHHLSEAKKARGPSGAKVVCVLSGGNADPTRL